MLRKPFPPLDDPLAMGLLVAAISTLGIFYIYYLGVAMMQLERAYDRWFKENNLRRVSSDLRTHYRGPFPMSNWRPVYYFVAVDQQNNVRKGWIRMGWLVFTYRELIEVHWDE